MPTNPPLRESVEKLIEAACRVAHDARTNTQIAGTSLWQPCFADVTDKVVDSMNEAISLVRQALQDEGVPTKPTTEQVVEALKGWTWTRRHAVPCDVYVDAYNGKVGVWPDGIECFSDCLILIPPPSPAPAELKGRTVREQVDEIMRKTSYPWSEEGKEIMRLFADRLDAIESAIKSGKA